MENTIKQILEIELRARKIIKEAQEIKAEIKQDALKDMKHLELNACSVRQDDINAIRNDKLSKALDEADKILAEAKEKCNLIEKDLEEKKEIWAKNVFDKIIKVH